jgi:predicted membrane protein
MNSNRNYSNNNNLFGGIVIILVGVVLLLKALGFVFPFWLVSWPVLLILLGILFIVTNKNKSGFGYFLIALGSFFLLKKYFFIPFELKQYFLPVGLIILGFYLIFKKRRENKLISDLFEKNNLTKKNQWSQNTDVVENSNITSESNITEQELMPESIYANAFFTGIVRRVFSKNFKGGKISAIFGGTDIDLTHADIQDDAIIDVEIAFGGVKLIVPAHWNVQINMGTVIAAGVEDKRFFSSTGLDPKKVLKIQGSIVFGGLEIKSI